MLTNSELCWRWKEREAQCSSHLHLVNPCSHHFPTNTFLPNPITLLSQLRRKKPQEKAKTQHLSAMASAYSFQGSSQKKEKRWNFIPPTPTKELNIKNRRGKSVICPAAPNSLHTATLGSEVEITQHANPTVSIPLISAPLSLPRMHLQGEHPTGAGYGTAACQTPAGLAPPHCSQSISLTCASSSTVNT